MTKPIIQTVKLAKLALSEINVRKAGNDLIEQFAADISARGILQNLIVTPVKKPRDNFAVIAGSRRYRALMLLAEQGAISPADYDVPVLVIEGDDASLSETSLAENFQHLAMSPADECRAFQHFIGQDGDIDGVAKRFGLTRKFVEGRLRLAALAEPIFEALAAGDITLEMAKAYASTASHERQLLVWNSYGKYNSYSADSIRRVIANETMKSTEPVALLVGADAYVAAGGTIDRDLFSDAGDRWVNPEIVETLAAKLMEDQAARLGTELGLAWVRPIASTNTWELARSLHRVNLPTVPMSPDEEARLAEIENRIDIIRDELEAGTLEDAAYLALEAEYDSLEEERIALHNRPKILPDELKGRVGAILTLTQTGQMELDSDYYSETPIRVTAIVDDEPAGEADGETTDGEIAEGEDGDEAVVSPSRVTSWQIEEGAATTSAGAPSPVKVTAAAPDGKALSQILFDQLAMQRRDVLGAALLGNPGLALDYMLFAMIDDRGLNYDGKSGTTIKAARPEDPVQAANMPPSRAHDYIGEFAEALDDNWKDAGSKVARFEAFRLLSDEAKAQWMAWIVATSLTAKDVYGTPAQNSLQNRLANILEIDVATWWRPTSINYFDRISKGAALSLLDQVGGPALSGRHASQKKTEISVSCEKLFSGNVIIEADTKAAALAWVPEAMRFTEAAPSEDEELSEAEDPDGIALDDEDDLSLSGSDDGDDDVNPDDEGLSLTVDDYGDDQDDREHADGPELDDHLELVAAE